MTAALNFHADANEASQTDFEPGVEVRPVLPPRWLGEGPLKSLYTAALRQGAFEPGPSDPFVVIITPSGETTEHTLRAEDTAYSTSKAFNAAGMATVVRRDKRSTMVYCIPLPENPMLTAADSLRRMWLQLWK